MRVDLERGAIVDARDTPFAPIQALAADPTGEWVAVGGGERASVAVTRWNSGEWHQLDQGLGNELLAMAFSPDGRWLAAGSTLLRVYSMPSGTKVFDRPSYDTAAILFTRDSDRLLASSGSMLEVIDTRRWTVIATFVDNMRGINALGYCPVTESLFASDVSRDIRHFRAAAKRGADPGR